MRPTVAMVATIGLRGRPVERHSAEQGADHGRDDRETGEAQVATARGRDGLGRADQPHQGLAPDQDRDGREDADATGEEQRSGDGLVDAGLVAAAVRPRDEDADRRADGAEGQDEDHRQAVGEADRRDGGGAKGADDDLVDDVLRRRVRTNSALTGTAMRAISRRGDGAAAGRLGVRGQGELSGYWLNVGTGGCARLRRKKSCPGMPDGPGSRPRPARPSYGEVGCGIKPVSGALRHHLPGFFRFATRSSADRSQCQRGEDRLTRVVGRLEIDHGTDPPVVLARGVVEDLDGRQPAVPGVAEEEHRRPSGIRTDSDVAVLVRVRLPAPAIVQR